MSRTATMPEMRWTAFGYRLAQWHWKVYRTRSFRNRDVTGLAVCLGRITFGVKRVKK